ncbi:YceI family protein [Candidatus Woesearchaeota archaeon]|nr:YceI family protein [Candidatus Woesearchaeota archaeon]
MKISYILLTVLSLLLIACSPSEDVPRATISDIDAEQAAVEEISNSSEMPESDALEAVIDHESSSIQFEGFGPGKSHNGTFQEWAGVLIIEDGNIIGLRGSIDPSSVSTGIGGLDTHLKNADFFDVDNYPVILFDAEINDGIASGPLTFHGITKDISFPVDVGEESVSADFVISLKEFGIEYIGVNDEVELRFDLTVE